MRSLLWSLGLVLLLSSGASAIRQVNFAGELSIEGPIAVTADPDGLLYISQEAGTILVLDQQMQALIRIGGRDSRLSDYLRSPAGLSVYNNRLYVADKRLGRVVVLTTSGDFIDYYGERGRDPGQFRAPEDVFVYRGVIYVADTGNNRIQVLGENGVFLKSFGETSDEKTSLDEPVRVSVCHRGRIHVLDKTGTIKIFNPGGDYLETVPGDVDVSAFSVDTQGLFVAESGLMSIKKYDFKGERILSFGSRGEGRAQFMDISSMAVTPQGTVCAIDARLNRIQAFRPEQREPSEMVVRAASPPVSAVWEAIIDTDDKRPVIRMLGRGDDVYALMEESSTVLNIADDISMAFTLDKMAPEALAFDSEGNIYVMERQKVSRLTAQGTVDYFFGTPERSRRYKPGDMVISETGLVYVADRQAPAIRIYNTDGVFIRTIEKYGDEEPIQDPVALAIDADDNLYVLDAGRRWLAIFSNDGKLLHGFAVGDNDAGPVDLAVSADRIYILDADRDRVDLFSATGIHRAGFGASGEAPGFLSRPSAIVAGDNSDLWIAETKNRRLQKFRVVDTPDPPLNLEAMAGSRSVRLQWDAPPSVGIDYYTVYRMDDRASGRLIKLGTVESFEYIDYTALTGVTSSYWVTAGAAYGNESSLSDPVTAAAEKLAVPPPDNLAAVPGDIAVTLSWDAGSSEHINRYVVYRGDEVAGSTAGHIYVVEGLVPETDYTLQVSAVSVDNLESEKASLTVSTQATTRPPVEIDVQSLDDVFSNTYKFYEENGVGRIVIRNNTGENISRLTVLFTMKHFMDFASETMIRDLAPGELRELVLKAVFNDQILNVTEDTPVQTEITASYYLRGEPRTYATKHSINVYEKHKMRWDDFYRLGAFVTPRDPVVMEFVRSVVIQYRHTTDPLVSAAVIFNALGEAGLTYVVDPSSPYQETSRNIELIDYLQYPRDTIRRKSGECDDLAIAYVTALESIGIRTKFLLVPGHILMMFAIGHQDQLGKDTRDDLLVIDKAGTVWVPVETTRVGRSFTDAWEAGSRNYYRCHPDERFTVDLRRAWEKYKPASLPLIDFKAPVVSRDAIDARFQNEYEVIRRTSVRIKQHEYVARLEDDPEDSDAKLQLGIAYAKHGILDAAKNLFVRALQNSPGDAALLNNIGNIHYLNQQSEKAISVYQQAVDADPADALILVNLVQALLQADRTQEAKNVFSRAGAMDPDLPRQFRSLALRLAH